MNKTLPRVAAIAAIFTGLSHAAIVMPTIVDAASTAPSAGPVGTFRANLIGNAGLFDGSTTTTATTATVNTGDTLAHAQSVYSEWDNDGHLTGYIVSEAATPAYIVFDLGFDMDLTNAVLWKYGNKSGSPAHSMKDFSFQFNSAAAGTGTFSGATSSFTLGLPSAGTGTSLGGQVTQAPETFSFSATDVRYVKMSLISNHPTGTAGNVSFNGIRFAAVPEPSSTALLGLGGLALILRRRK